MSKRAKEAREIARDLLIISLVESGARNMDYELLTIEINEIVRQAEIVYNKIANIQVRRTAWIGKEPLDSVLVEINAEPAIKVDYVAVIKDPIEYLNKLKQAYKLAYL